MRSGSGLRFFAIGAFLLLVGLLLSNATRGDCPDTEKYMCACPDPPTTVDCKTLAQKVCEQNHGQLTFACYWACKYTKDCGTQCVDGQEAMCWVDYECEWSITENRCQIDAETDVKHNAVLKVNEDCQPPS